MVRGFTNKLESESLLLPFSVFTNVEIEDLEVKLLVPAGAAWCTLPTSSGCTGVLSVGPRSLAVFSGDVEFNFGTCFCSYSVFSVQILVFDDAIFEHVFSFLRYFVILGVFSLTSLGLILEGFLRGFFLFLLGLSSFSGGLVSQSVLVYLKNLEYSLIPRYVMNLI